MALIDSLPPKAGALPIGVMGADDLYRLGLVYSTGQGDDLDLIQAHMWFNLAAMHGSDAAKRCRKELAEHMTTREIAAAQRAAREWLAHRGRLH